LLSVRGQDTDLFRLDRVDPVFDVSCQTDDSLHPFHVVQTELANEDWRLSARVTVEVVNLIDRHPSDFVKCADVCLLSRSALVTLIDVSAHTVESWSSIRPHLRIINRGDVIGR
jgi:hypothetical protein